MTTDLGTVGGPDSNTAESQMLNSSGELAGFSDAVVGFSVNNDLFQRAFLWEHDSLFSSKAPFYGEK